MTTIEQLDEVLNKYYEVKKQITIQDLHKMMPNYHRDELVSIIDKLLFDKYIIPRDEAKWIFQISWQGKFIKESGGYQNLNERQSAMENRQFRRERLLVRINFSLAFSAGAAAIYYLLEIYRIWIEPHLCHK